MRDPAAARSGASSCRGSELSPRFTRGDVRRAKLYYLRDLRGKAAKIKEKRETVSR